MHHTNSWLRGLALGLVLTMGPALPAHAQRTTDAVTSTATIDFGDDTSQWANDGECDDPRFQGTGTAAELVEADLMKDATDCAAAVEAGTATLIAATIDFGDDSGEWANDGECDDPRFEGTGAAAELVEADLMKDATDCAAAVEAGTVTLSTAGDGPAIATALDYGDDSSQWANDGECDDPRFRGPGVASDPISENLMRDASDCQAAFEAGTATLVADTGPPVGTAGFDYGADTGKWANDGECDDPRFTGTGTDKKLLYDDIYADATDCRTLEAAGSVRIRPVYHPSYAAGAPYDSSEINFGTNTSDYADDDYCDDPRFEGPGAATVLLEGDLMHDRNDCQTAFEAGTVVLLEQ